MERHVQRGGSGLFGLIVFIAICWWGYNHFIRTDRPWWNGEQVQYVCAIHQQGNFNCYSLYVTVEDNQIVQMSFPNGGYATIVYTNCYKSDVRVCDFTDSHDREWEVKKL